MSLFLDHSVVFCNQSLHWLIFVVDSCDLVPDWLVVAAEVCNFLSGSAETFDPQCRVVS